MKDKTQGKHEAVLEDSKDLRRRLRLEIKDRTEEIHEDGWKDGGVLMGS